MGRKRAGAPQLSFLIVRCPRFRLSVFLPRSPLSNVHTHTHIRVYIYEYVEASTTMKLTENEIPIGVEFGGIRVILFE